MVPINVLNTREYAVITRHVIINENKIKLD